ncbi:MAG TPA: PD-(D/E)XK nuclease family protein [Solirubrobacteraceae bacterium]|nr:PD-(D/E)XK nuclease family protein [Solirubrobacteraceae bacterium]
MPITLITGPANSGKARLVLDAVRAHVAHGHEPLLVVPTRADIERYRQELAAGGLVLGAAVERFDGLIGEVVARAGRAQSVLGPTAREWLLAAVAARAATAHTAAAAASTATSTPAASDAPALLDTGAGFRTALVRLVAELEVERVSPARLRAALRAWSELDRPRAQRARELSALFEGYQAACERMRRVDAETQTVNALDALRRAPALWRERPVLFYGFDDFDRLQLDAIQTLGAVVDAPVTVSLTFEPGRLAFAGRAGTFQTLLPLASRHEQLRPRAEHYAEGARAVLHHLERSLFEPDSERVEPGGAVRLLEGGGERAEIELVAGEIRALLDGGMAAQEIALVHRAPESIAALLDEVLEAFEIPYSLERRLPFAHTATGRALLGLLCAACGGTQHGLAEGESRDLLMWLRAPGVLERPELADRLEARARRAGASSAAQTRALWESEHWPLDALDRVSEAAERGSTALIERLARELEWIFAASRRGQAALLGADELDEAHALAVGRRALGELRELARAAPELAPNAAALVELLRGLELVSGERPGDNAVAVLSPLALRARRVRALFLCGLQESVFPAPARPEPLLSDDQRRGLAEASGLLLSRQPDALAAERYLLYAAVSRPHELLVLSWHTADDDGVAAAPSLFVDDVCDLLEPDAREQRVRRPLGAAGWPGPGAPTPALSGRELALSEPRARERPLAALSDERLLAQLRERTLWSASSLETWVSCPVRWFVERLLHADPLEPDPEPFARGRLAHAALKDTLEGLRERTGSARMTAQRLPLARRLLAEALERHAEDHPLSTLPERIPAVRRRLELDLERYLEHAAELASPLEPAHLELAFGFADEHDGLGPLVLGEDERGEQISLRGRIDRVDVAVGNGNGDGNGKTVIYDYKTKNPSPAGRWEVDGNLQVPLYMSAVEQLLQLNTVGGFYQPYSSRDMRARGVLADDADLELQCVKTDRRERVELDELVEHARALALSAAGQARAGALRPTPDSCDYQGGCRYPTICRCEP